MRLAIATPLYPPEIGGPATDSSSLAAALTARGREVEVAPFSAVRRYPKFIRHIAYAAQLFKASRGARCIVAFDMVSVGLPALVVARLRRIPLIVRIPGDYAWEQGTQRFGVQDSIEDFQHRRYGLAVEALRFLQRLTVRHADLVLVISDYFKSLTNSWGLQEKRVVRIYLGLDPDEAFELPTVQTTRKIMFSLGRFVPWKGFSMLVGLLQELTDWELVIAGDGPLRQKIEEEARSLGVSDRLRLTGTLTRSQVLGWYRRADTFVLNTSQENFSYQTLEGMLSGTPVIATNIGSIPELIESGVEGMLCSPNDRPAFLEALRSVEREPEAWKKRTAAAVKKGRSFSLASSMDAFVAAIDKVCG